MVERGHAVSQTAVHRQGRIVDRPLDELVRTLVVRTVAVRMAAGCTVADHRVAGHRVVGHMVAGHTVVDHRAVDRMIVVRTDRAAVAAAGHGFEGMAALRMHVVVAVHTIDYTEACVAVHSVGIADQIAGALGNVAAAALADRIVHADIVLGKVLAADNRLDVSALAHRALVADAAIAVEFAPVVEKHSAAIDMNRGHRVG